MKEQKSGNKPQLHATSLEMFCRCPEQFRRRYIENEVIPPGVAAVIGRSVDHSVNSNLQHKINTEGGLLEKNIVEDIARDQASSQFDNNGVRLNEDEVQEGIKKVRGQAIDTSVKLSSLHYDEAAPTIAPISIQRQWVIEIENYPFDLAGTIDVEEKTVIRDTKTKKQSPPKNIAETSLQLTMYALAKVKCIDGNLPEKLILDFLVNLKTPKYKPIETTRSEEDFKPLLKRIEVVADAIEKEVFLPADSNSWMCSERWCGFAASCRYFRKIKK